jgi:hypothetical protein
MPSARDKALKLTFAQLQSSLLRCPFCGFDAGLAEISVTVGTWIAPGWTVACLDESCIGSSCTLTWREPLDAALAWNKRSERARELSAPVRGSD